MTSKDIITSSTLGLTVGIFLVNILFQPPKELIPSVMAYESSGLVEATPTPEPIHEKIGYVFEGKVSYYSHSGCLGCSENQVMGNGEAFDENAMTIAVPCEHVVKPARVRYGTRVRVTNSDNGKSVEARITDCGGFSKYNRIADLSKGVYEALGASTDKTIIRIEAL